MLEPWHELPPLAGCELPERLSQYSLSPELEHTIVRTLGIGPHRRIICVGRQTRIAVEQTDLVEGLGQPRVGTEDVTTFVLPDGFVLSPFPPPFRSRLHTL